MVYALDNLGGFPLVLTLIKDGLVKETIHIFLVLLWDHHSLRLQMACTVLRWWISCVIVLSAASLKITRWVSHFCRTIRISCIAFENWLHVSKNSLTVFTEIWFETFLTNMKRWTWSDFWAFAPSCEQSRLIFVIVTTRSNTYCGLVYRHNYLVAQWGHTVWWKLFLHGRFCRLFWSL